MKRLGFILLLAACSLTPLARVAGQQIVYREGFNDDGDGTRYTVTGRGSSFDDQNAAAWEHSFLVDALPHVSLAPAKRAAMLMEHDYPADIWSDQAWGVAERLVDWAVDGNPSANIYMLPLGFGESTDALAQRLQTLGHTVNDLALGTGIPADADLVINTTESRPDPLSLFVGADVPLISLNARGHDSALVVTRGASIRFNDAIVVEANASELDHPVLGGLSGEIEWTNEPFSSSMRGLGPRVAPGGSVLATYLDPASGDPQPALVVVEAGAELLGGLNPQNVEGDGYWVGTDLNHDFGGVVVTEDEPRTIQLAPVDVRGLQDLQLTIALAASDFDIDSNDYLRILVDRNNSGDFQVLGEFAGDESYRFSDGTTILGPDQFTDVTWNIEGDADDLVIRLESFSTFSNEFIAFDNIRISAAGLPGDFDGSGTLDVGDVDLLTESVANGSADLRFDLDGDTLVTASDLTAWVALANTWLGDANLDGEFNSGDLVAVFTAGKFETNQPAVWSQGDWNADGLFDSGDFVTAFTAGGYELGPRPATVPEPGFSAIAGIMLTLAVARVWRKG